jgi:hypothetical protein
MMAKSLSEDRRSELARDPMTRCLNHDRPIIDHRSPNRSQIIDREIID